MGEERREGSWMLTLAFHCLTAPLLRLHPQHCGKSQGRLGHGRVLVGKALASLSPSGLTVPTEAASHSWDVAVTEVGPSPPGPAGIDCGLVQTPASAAKLFSCPGNKNCSPRPQGICLPPPPPPSLPSQP